MQSMFFNNIIKLEINNRKITGKSPNTQKLSNTLTENTQVKEEISGGEELSSAILQDKYTINSKY